MATETKRVDALQLIFSFFLGILLVVVIGVGVWTFYPQPYREGSPEQQELQKLYREQERTAGKVPGGTTNEAEFNRIQKQIDEIQAKMQKARDRWAVNTSIILLTFATALMAISLFLPEHMRVFSNGILLGGLFSVVYGTGWSFAGGDSRARFFVVLVALVLSVAFGYLRFIRGKREREMLAAEGGLAVGAEGGAGVVGGDAYASLTARVAALEARAEAAAAALRGGDRED